MLPWRRMLCALAILLSVAAAHAEEIRIHLITHGAIEAEVTVAHDIDRAHFCSAAPDPWTAPDGRDTRGSPFPFYRLVFGQDGPGAELAQPGPSLGLTLSNYFAAEQEHSDPVDDSIEVVLNGRHFVGHAGMEDTGYRLAVSYREDRRGGGFVARRLREEGGSGQGALDLQGNWECPAVASDLPEQEVSEHRLFAGAVPVYADPIPLRVSRSDIPCVDRDCAGWRVTNELDDTAYLARVDFSRLRLAPQLLRLVERGVVDLLIGAEVHRGDPPQVIALVLDGVEPTPPPSAKDTPGPIPQAALP